MNTNTDNFILDFLKRILFWIVLVYRELTNGFVLVIDFNFQSGRHAIPLW